MHLRPILLSNSSSHLMSLWVAAPSSVSPSDLYFQSSINFQSEVVFVGNGGCSPSAVSDYLQIGPFIVPTVEARHLAMRFYKAQPSAGVDAPQRDLVYFDLVVRSCNCLVNP